MAIVSTVYSASNFRDQFIDSGRGDNFSYQGFEALYDYLDELSDDIGENIELDPVTICCDYSECNLDDLKREYDYLVPDEDFDQDDIDQWRDLLQDCTTVIRVDEDSLIVQSF